MKKLNKIYTSVRFKLGRSFKTVKDKKNTFKSFIKKYTVGKEKYKFVVAVD